MCSTVISLIFCSIVIALTGIYIWLTYCLDGKCKMDVKWKKDQEDK